MPEIIFIATFVLNVVAREFIYSVVGQVHVQIVKIVLVWRSVFARCESAQTFLVEEDAQGVHTAQQHINAQIEFQFVYQEWLMEISLDYVVLIWIKVFQVPRQENTSTLRCSFGLGDESLAIGFPSLFGLISELLLKFTKLCWQQPGLWKELVLFWKNSRHSLQISRQVVFTREGIHAGEVIDSLVGFHSIQFVDLHCSIRPEKVPLVVWVLIVSHVGRATQSHFELIFGNIAHNVILCLRDIQNELLSFESPPFLHDFVFLFLAFSCYGARCCGVFTGQRALRSCLIW